MISISHTLMASTLLLILIGQEVKASDNHLIEDDMFLINKQGQRVHLQLGKLYRRGWQHQSQEFPRGLWKIDRCTDCENGFNYWLQYENGTKKNFKVAEEIWENDYRGHIFEFRDHGRIKFRMWWCEKMEPVSDDGIRLTGTLTMVNFTKDINKLLDDNRRHKEVHDFWISNYDSYSKTSDEIKANETRDDYFAFHFSHESQKVLSKLQHISLSPDLFMSWPTLHRKFDIKTDWSPNELTPQKAIIQTKPKFHYFEKTVELGGQSAGQMVFWLGLIQQTRADFKAFLTVTGVDSGHQFNGKVTLDSDQILHCLRNIRAKRVVNTTENSVTFQLNGIFLTSFVVNSFSPLYPKTLEEYKVQKVLYDRKEDKKGTVNIWDSPNGLNHYDEERVELEGSQPEDNRQIMSIPGMYNPSDTVTTSPETVINTPQPSVKPKPKPEPEPQLKDKSRITFIEL